MLYYETFLTLDVRMLIKLTHENKEYIKRKSEWQKPSNYQTYLVWRKL